MLFIINTLILNKNEQDRINLQAMGSFLLTVRYISLLFDKWKLWELVIETYNC
jgi:hypothetical protein